ncbi:MAG: DUF2071 domain-containing protein [Planctomycetales bacterium]|nr:DUF2071 domain-containing protein [Planctomycetales bacterium]
MKIPRMRGLIDRRVLVNFRVDADVLRRLCPPPFRPQTVDGFGVAGICLIRLKNIRPNCLPAYLGVSSENAAHRLAVEWDENGRSQTGVYIPRRDTSSALNAFAGGRIFPGIHHRARFQVRETEKEYYVSMKSLDGSTDIVVDGYTTDQLPGDSLFATVSECSRFFEEGSLGYSPEKSFTKFDGLEIKTENWHVQPLAVTQVQSTFFDDREAFPSGSVTFDSALLMRGIHHEWHSHEPICCTGN